MPIGPPGWTRQMCKEHECKFVSMVQMLAPAPSTQTCTRAPDTFDGSNPEDLWAFLLQCQITFNAHPQNFTSEAAKVCFEISYQKKTALEWFEQGILEDHPSQAPG